MSRVAGSGEIAGSDRRPWIGLWLAVLLVHLVLAVHAARIETPTVDEFAHLPAGCAAWTSGNFDLYAKSPPLARLWMSLPVALEPGVAVPPVRSSPHGWGPWRYGADFMNANRPDYLGLFFRARLMIVLLSLATAALLLAWGRRVFGLPTAVLVSSLFLLSPTALAHGHLATTDMACAFTLLLAVWTLRASSRHPGPVRAALAGLALGAALAVKFTGLLLLPLVPVFYLIVRRRGARRSLLRDLAVVGVVALIVVNAVMLFTGSFQPLHRYDFESGFMKAVAGRLPGWTPVPLPHAYVEGYDFQKRDTEAGEEFGSYLAGRWSREGWWYYNLVALAVKETEPFLLLILLAPWFWWRRKAGSREAWLFFAPVLVLFVLLSFFNRLDLGIRYLLPGLPFLCLAGGAAIEPLIDRRDGWLRRAGLVLLLGYPLAAALMTHPWPPRVLQSRLGEPSERTAAPPRLQRGLGTGSASRGPAFDIARTG